MSFLPLNWANKPADVQLSMAQEADRLQLRDMARRYDWQLSPEKVLGWIVGQTEIDLASAVTVFFAGDPERFNYIPPRDVPERYRQVTRLLDDVCERINTGFYRHEAGSEVDQEKRFNNWLIYQAEDRLEDRQGRWMLNERIVRALEPAALFGVPV